MDWTPEPWQHIWKHDTHKVKRDKQGHMLDSITLNLNDYDRAIECVNALAGIEYPASFMVDMVNVLREIERAGRAIQFKQDDRPEFHARRIQQLVRAAAQSMGETYYNTKKVQEPALPEPSP